MLEPLKLQYYLQLPVSDIGFLFVKNGRGIESFATNSFYAPELKNVQFIIPETGCGARLLVFMSHQPWAQGVPAWGTEGTYALAYIWQQNIGLQYWTATLSYSGVGKNKIPASLEQSKHEPILRWPTTQPPWPAHTRLVELQYQPQSHVTGSLTLATKLAPINGHLDEPPPFVLSTIGQPPKPPLVHPSARALTIVIVASTNGLLIWL